MQKPVTPILVAPSRADVSAERSPRSLRISSRSSAPIRSPYGPACVPPDRKKRSGATAAKPSSARRWHTRRSCGEMPGPSWITMTPGHGGDAAGVATKYGSAMSVTLGRYRVRALRRPGPRSTRRRDEHLWSRRPRIGEKDGRSSDGEAEHETASQRMTWIPPGPPRVPRRGESVSAQGAGCAVVRPALSSGPGGRRRR